MSRGGGSGEGGHPTLLQNNSLKVYGLTEAGTRPGGRTHRKPKDLSVCESEECGHGEGGGVYTTLMESDTVIHDRNLVAQK